MKIVLLHKTQLQWLFIATRQIFLFNFFILNFYSFIYLFFFFFYELQFYSACLGDKIEDCCKCLAQTYSSFTNLSFCLKICQIASRWSSDYLWAWWQSIIHLLLFYIFIIFCFFQLSMWYMTSYYFLLYTQEKSIGFAKIFNNRFSMDLHVSGRPKTHFNHF